jgi:CelD/BcsL family acetyltransferase involved in cellulose biosynthesis
MLKLQSISSLAEFRASAPAWDDLWQRSDAGWPTLQAESLALWSEQFAGPRAFRALAVYDGIDLVAALPMIRQRLARLLPVSRLTGNAWWPAGDLLLDPTCQTSAVLDTLVDGLTRHARPLVCCDAVQLATPRWQSFTEALDRASLAHQAVRRGEVGCVDISSRWDAYLATRSRNLRRQIRVVEKRAAQLGQLELRLIASPLAGDLPELLRQGFAVEDRSWKGTTGSSVLRSPAMFDYYARQATLLASRGELLLAYLQVGDEIIAFEYGLVAKGVYYSLKVGYDERHAELSPGQLLRAKMIEQFSAAGQPRAIDFLGPLVEATARWTTRTYDVSRLIIATSTAGRLLLAARRAAQAWKARGPRRVKSDTATASSVLDEAEQDALQGDCGKVAPEPLAAN